MTFRIDYTTEQKGIYQAMARVGHAIGASGFERSLVELVNIRASQINGCAYCLSLHIPDALKAGVTQEQLDLLVTWEECGDLFSPRERAALAWRKHSTRLADVGHDDALWEEVCRHFSDDEALALTWAIAAINTWNRVAVPMHRPIRRR